MDGYLIDLHCHTAERSFDASAAAADIVASLVVQGFHGVVFTDHAATWSRADLEEVRASAGAPPEFFLAAGQEIHTRTDGGTAYGDLLVYGPTEDIPEYSSPKAVLDAARDAGGLAIAAHLAAKGVGIGDKLGDYPIPAAETWNGRYGPRVAQKSEALAREFGVACVGGSDTHTEAHIGGGGTIFPDAPRDLLHLCEMIRAGDCTPWRPGPSGVLRRLLGR